MEVPCLTLLNKFSHKKSNFPKEYVQPYNPDN